MTSAAEADKLMIVDNEQLEDYINYGADNEEALEYDLAGAGDPLDTKDVTDSFPVTVAETSQTIESGKNNAGDPSGNQKCENNDCYEQIGPEVHVGKPQVWVRICPSSSTSEFDNKAFEISDDNKTLKLLVNKPKIQKKPGKKSPFKFHTDGIIQADRSQEETYALTVQEIVEKAMDGISGVIVCCGPENSGKSHTMFGLQSTYQLRGLLPRAIEKAFEIMETKDGMEYHLIFSMFEIRKDKIKDLLTLAPGELRRVGDFGPMGMFMEEITSVEQALSLILRAVIGQKQIPREPYCKCHTIAYLDILAQDHNEHSNNTQKKFRSRITFAKIASMPKRDTAQPLSLGTNVQWSDCICPHPGCFACLAKINDPPSTKCCRGPPGELAESISTRKDMSFLEQMFIRAHNIRKINDYYSKLQSMGMYMLMKPPTLAPSQYFRQSKLAHCLKDIVTGRTVIRLILHVRSEREHLQSSLEVMRFADRARCHPFDIPKKGELKKCQLFEERISQMCQELGIPDPVTNTVRKKGSVELPHTYGQISPDKMKEILQQATSYFEEKLDSLGGACKNQVKGMFETFRKMWNYMVAKEACQEEEDSKKTQQYILQVPIVEAIANQKVVLKVKLMLPRTHHTEDVSEAQDEYSENGENRKLISSRNGKGMRDNKDGAGKVRETRSKDRMDSQGKKNASRKASLVQIRSKSLIISPPSPPSPLSSRNNDNDLSLDGDSSELETDEEEMEEEQQVVVEVKEVVKEVIEAPPPPTTGGRKSGSKGKKKKEKAEKVEAPPPPTPPPEPVPQPQQQPVVQAVQPSPPPSTAEPPLDDQIPMSVPEGVQRKTSVSFTSEPNSDANGELQLNLPPVFNQLEAWAGFVKSEFGGSILTQFADKQAMLRQCIMDHNETQKESSNLVARLTQLQMNLDILEQERQWKGNLYDESGKAIISSQEQKAHREIEGIERSQHSLMMKLQELRSILQFQKSLLWIHKKECENAFQAYCLDIYGKPPDIIDLPLSLLDHAMASTAQETLGFPKLDSMDKADMTQEQLDAKREAITKRFEKQKKNAQKKNAQYMQSLSGSLSAQRFDKGSSYMTSEELAAQREEAIGYHFDDLKKIAQQEVDILLQAYPKRPTWVTYY